eukprot:14114453-Alexandrium_andersonii.AAC.1
MHSQQLVPHSRHCPCWGLRCLPQSVSCQLARKLHIVMRRRMHPHVLHMEMIVRPLPRNPDCQLALAMLSQLQAYLHMV